MTELFSILCFLREKCDENLPLRQVCQAIAVKYLESEKSEMRAQHAYEENIVLKLELGTMQSIHHTITSNNEAYEELYSLLSEYYEEHLKAAYNEGNLEKLTSYDELKFELESRDSMAMYQQLYWRKMETSAKMENRNIVKQYKLQEQEFLETHQERRNLEQKVQKLSAKAEKFKTRRLEETKLILQLVEGKAHIDANCGSQQRLSQSFRFESQRLSEISYPDMNVQKVGLSSKLFANFKQFTMPPIHTLPKLRQINQNNGLDHLLQQSEAIRKSMQTRPIVLSNEIPTPKFPGILKVPKVKSNPTENAPKTVSFDVNIHQTAADLTRTLETTQEETPKLSENILEVIEDSEMEESLIEKEPKKKPNINILENLLIRPPDSLVNSQESQAKKDNQVKQDDVRHAAPTSSKVASSPFETPFRVSSKTFMDLFLDFSRETQDIPSPHYEPIEKPKQSVRQTPEKKNSEEIVEKNQYPKPSTKVTKKQTDGFEELFSKYASDMAETADDNDQSFDFFQTNDGDENNLDDAASDNFPFNF